MVNLLIVLIPLAAWSGFWLALRHESRQRRQNALRNTYLEGLNALLHDQTDQALESFIHLSNLDQQTLDTQLTLATLFRKRGELDRALHLHQQLLEYPLQSALRTQVERELARDYAQVGMYREAVLLYEAHWAQSALAEEKAQLAQALIKLYERLGEWQVAIDLLERQAPLSAEDGERLAHYQCELAQSALNEGRNDEARQKIQSALQHAPSHIRAHWLRAEWLIKHQDPIQALHDLHHIGEHAPQFVPEILPLLEHAYRDLGQLQAFERFLLDLEQRHPNPRLTLAIAKALYPLNPAPTHALLEKRLLEQKNPLLLAAHWQFRQSQTQTHPDDRPAAPTPEQQLILPLTPKTVYQCEHCGFRQQKMRWYCAACRTWHGYQPLLILQQEYKHPRPKS